MPKEGGDRSLSHDSSRASPYPSSSSRVRRSAPKTPLDSVENVKEWEEARCPVCMEHPHNAVLLICSSHEKGCRPYMCNTSYRHSNCLDQFCKSFTEASETIPQVEPQEEPQVESQVSNTNTSPVQSTEANTIDMQEGSEGFVTMQPLSCEYGSKSKLVCPLCRGQIKEWTVVDAARHFMNEKSRSCSCETCDFSGTYPDLRKHARVEHPLERPSVVDPERQRTWRRLERQRDLGDLLSTLQTSFGESRADGGLPLIDDGGLLAVFFLILQPTSSASRGTTRTRLQMRIRRHSSRLWGENYEGESGSASRDDDANESSDGGSDNRRRRVRRRVRPDDDQP
ncbi:putative Zinc finger, RING/FYVE/PHD-type [Lupinus albus]|uniref:Putative Zinc finger, RING/FYVE/PHD-type n=1 Tax=Lupinus albus TaxID=3870 RepID=A0A6A4Q6B2_LUPAL|nr:putative Zinc finger, RING/FYVE/PHD-type [Lupinus albus]